MKHYMFCFASLLAVVIQAQGAGLPGIQRVPALVAIRASDARASENTNDTAEFVVRRSLNMHSALVVFYRISGTAANGIDYDRLTGSVEFAPGQSMATVLVTPIDDFKMEARETVTLRLLPAHSTGPDVAYRIRGASSATITIGDNDLVLAPEAVGTVGRWPDLELPDIVREGTLQATYFRTTESNREFRRAFLEFEIPVLPRGIGKATLLITRSGGAEAVLELSAYPADLAITLGDYDQAVTEITTFEADPDPRGETFVLDVTDIVKMSQGQNLGLRIKLAIDPVFAGEGFAGVGFQEASQAFPPRLVIQTPRN
jgi:hypothetical protein